MNTKKFSEAISEVDDKYYEEAANYERKQKNRSWIKWGAMAACLCLVVAAAVTIPSVFKPDVGEGGGTPITSDPDHSISEITPTLFTQQEIIEEIKRDIERGRTNKPQWRNRRITTKQITLRAVGHPAALSLPKKEYELDENGERILLSSDIVNITSCYINTLCYKF